MFEQDNLKEWMDERHRLYGDAIKARDYLPIRGNWVEAVRKDRKRKAEEKRLKRKYK